MRKITARQRQLTAEYLTQIAVAWFAAGVISIFLGNLKTIPGILSSLAWGLFFSTLFFSLGFFLIKEVKNGF